VHCKPIEATPQEAENQKTICESPFSAWPIQHGRLAAKGRDYKLVDLENARKLEPNNSDKRGNADGGSNAKHHGAIAVSWERLPLDQRIGKMQAFDGA